MHNTPIDFVEYSDGLPLVFVHGFPFDFEIWKVQLDDLLDAGRLFAIDLPGFGGSEPLGGEPTMDNYARAVAEWARSQGLEKIVLAGHSMGGYIALAFARNYPEMLAGLVLIASRAGADSEQARENRYKLIAGVEERGAEAAAEAMLPKLLATNTEPDRRQELEHQIRDIILRQPPEAITTALRALAERPDSTESLSRITVPALVISGLEDALIPSSEGQDMARRISRADFVAIDGAGHMPMMERPQEVNEPLRSFMQSLSNNT